MTHFMNDSSKDHVYTEQFTNVHKLLNCQEDLIKY